MRENNAMVASVVAASGAGAGNGARVAYPPLPDKRFFTIGEATALAHTKPHIARYWEREIPALARVSRRRGGRRFYSADDVLLLRRVNDLVTRGGYTIAGARQALSADEGAAAARVKKIALRRELQSILELL